MVLQQPDLEDFFQSGPFALHCVSGDGMILRANAAELEMVGYPEHEYVGRNIAEFHADNAAIGEILERLSRGEKLLRFPATLVRKDGTLRNVEITSNGCFQDGALVNSRCLAVDVTEARQSEIRSRFLERHWRETVEALPAAVYTTDAEGRITYFNDAAVELSGRTPVLGSDSWCVTWRLFKLDGTPLPHDACPMAVALKERRPIRGEEAIAERPDGSRVRFQPYPTPLFDEQGNLTGAVNMLVDVTQQRQDEADAARLAAIVVSSNDAMVSKTLEGIVTSWNDGAKRIFGYTADDMIGQSIMRIIPEDLWDEERHILSKLRAGERLDHYETVRVAKDGRRIHVSLSISLIRDNRVG